MYLNLPIEPLALLEQVEDAYRGESNNYGVISALNIALWLGKYDPAQETIMDEVDAIIDEMALIADGMLYLKMFEHSRKRLEQIRAVGQNLFGTDEPPTEREPGEVLT